MNVLFIHPGKCETCGNPELRGAWVRHGQQICLLCWAWADSVGIRFYKRRTA